MSLSNFFFLVVSLSLPPSLPPSLPVLLSVFKLAGSPRSTCPCFPPSLPHSLLLSA